MFTSSGQAQNLFVADSNGDMGILGGGGGYILEFTSDGSKSTFASNLPDARGLAFDSAGDLFVSDALGGNIYKFTPGGVKSTFASGLSLVSALAFDSAGNLYAYGNGNIYKLKPDGIKSTFASGFIPSALAFDSAGNLLAADSSNGNIYEFTPGGDQSTFASGLTRPACNGHLTARGTCSWRMSTPVSRERFDHRNCAGWNANHLCFRVDSAWCNGI